MQIPFTCIGIGLQAPFQSLLGHKMSTNWQDNSWQQEFLEMKAHKPEDIKLLMAGPRGLMDALKLGSLHEEYKRLKKRQSNE